MSRTRPRGRRVSLVPKVRRIDRASKNEHGWQVGFMRRRRSYNTYFADSLLGGRRAALEQALVYRDAELLRLEPPVRIRRHGHAPGNKTGVVGVRLERYRVEGRVYYRYRASWPDADGGIVRRSFARERYGAVRAFGLAVDARRKGILELKRQLRERILGLLKAGAKGRRGRG